MEYSKTNCHFCKSPLNELYQCSDYNCNCEYKYQNVVDANGVVFVIDNNRFTIYTGSKQKTWVYNLLSRKALVIDYALDVTVDNYLQQIERVKKLQTFK